MPIKFHTDNRPGRIDRLEPLTNYLKSAEPVMPEALSDSAYRKLSDAARNEYDDARAAYLSGGIFLRTGYYSEARRMLFDCFENNHANNTGNTGTMLSGEGTVGKTTIAKKLMKWVYADYKRVFPDFERHNRIPVVYVEVPTSSTGKALMVGFADFLGLTYRPGDSMTSLRGRVTQALNDAGTQLVVVDELHNLSRSTVATGETVQILKELHDDLPATFMYAGVKLTTEGKLLDGPLGQQVAGRFSILEMHRYSIGNPQSKAVWNGVVEGFARNLTLRHQEPDALLEMATYLWERTNGNISSLSSLLTGTAQHVIRNPHITEERLDKALLDTRVLDFAAETARRARIKRKADPMSVENITKGLAYA
ncbi:ATP-binding protein [Diaminobutyricimonas sp. LJ205]|uniref:ATP-binding protein n=1 Tax=Diaminobutyricimonas sp. LJ205 TaxID=2683590 RepID=UPI0012F49D55|nr:ATP-binding protein [Diaminobutyricimonas sp. LJ205]